MAQFPESFLEELRNRVSLPGLIGRHVRLTKRGRDYLGLCPFHNEKTPSFHVYDDHYHCFGCGAHGDAIEFMKSKGGLSFHEAIEQLAGEAGLAVPQQRPEDRERDKQAASLSTALEECAKWYEGQLQAAVGREAKAYVERRGLSRETIARFRIGYAPGASKGGPRTALKEAMLARNIPEALLIESGMLIKPDDGGASYDRFRNRVMFPISDRRGRVIAFGGRALDPDAPAKYLNSPETPLFHKSHTLYNIALAREASREAGTVLVAEGYMDVIALAQAGISHAVAPLGTALTEDQMALLWRMAAEPILCFDGDKAGLKAALRAVDRALPLLEPGKSFRFALLPAGQDPDDLVKAGGRAAMEEVLAQALPLSEMLWRKETEGQAIDTPERRAALENTLKAAAFRIKHPAVQNHYREHLRERLRNLFAPARPSRPPGPGQMRGGQNRPGFAGGWAGERWTGGRPGFGRPIGDLAAPQAPDAGDRREKALLLGLLRHPWLVEDHAEAVARLTFPNHLLDSLKMRILEEASRHPGLDGEGLASHLRGQGLGTSLDLVFGEEYRVLEPFTKAETLRDKVERGWFQAVQRYRLNELEKELATAQAELAEDMSPDAWRRFSALQAEVGAARSQVSASDDE